MADAALKEEIEARFKNDFFHHQIQAGTALKEGGRVEGSTAAQTRHFFKCFGSLWVEHVYERTNFDTDLCYSFCYVTLGLHYHVHSGT